MQALDPKGINTLGEMSPLFLCETFPFLFPCTRTLHQAPALFLSPRLLYDIKESETRKPTSVLKQDPNT